MTQTSKPTTPVTPIRANKRLAPEPYGRELAALVTIETAEALAMEVDEALSAGDVELARRLLRALVDATTSRICSRVKTLELADQIAEAARVSVGYHLALIGSERQRAEGVVLE